jgi:hypothetical protein
VKRIVDLVLALVAVEAVGLSAFRRATGRGVPPSGLLANLLAGASLLAALRFALRGTATAPILASLAVAGIAHAADVRGRWGEA